MLYIPIEQGCLDQRIMISRLMSNGDSLVRNLGMTCGLEMSATLYTYISGEE